MPKNDRSKKFNPSISSKMWKIVDMNRSMNCKSLVKATVDSTNKLAIY